MSLKTLVKVGNISNLSDARYCSGMGVEMLGFQVIEGRDNYIDPKTYQEIRGWLSGPVVVLEVYGLSSETNFNSLIENYSPDFLELGLADITNLPQTSIRFLVSVDRNSLAKNAEKLKSIKGKIEYIIINESEGLTFIKQLANEYPVLVKLHSQSNINALLENFDIKGVALNGSKEIKPGLKDYDHLAEVLEQLEQD